MTNDQFIARLLLLGYEETFLLPCGVERLFNLFTGSVTPDVQVSLYENGVASVEPANKIPYVARYAGLDLERAAKTAAVAMEAALDKRSTDS